MVKLKIDNIDIEVQKGLTIFEAAKILNIKIPSLCYNKHLLPYGSCRICLVELVKEGSTEGKFVSSCTYIAEDGLNVLTNTERIKERRKFILQLLLSRTSNAEELLEFAEENGIDIDINEDEVLSRYLLNRVPEQEKTKCILCALCVRVCNEVTKRSALAYSERGYNKKVTPPFKKYSTKCIGCGSCAYLCPTNTVTIEELD